jgi:FkbM family methyltransferase
MGSKKPGMGHIVRAGAVKLLWVASGALVGHGSHPGRYWSRVLGGPIRGARIVMPHQERPSYVLGSYENHVVAAMRAHIRTGMVAYDIGAHVGYHTLTLSKLVGQTGTVIAIEADPHNRSMLETNIETNRASNVKIVPLVISDTVGTARFATFSTYSSVSHIADAETPNDAEVLEIHSTSLDELIYGSNYPVPALVKIDVEGAEARLFRGAMRMMREARPIIIAEARRGSTLEEIVELAKSLSYQARVLDSGSRLAEGGVVDVLFSPVMPNPTPAI